MRHLLIAAVVLLLCAAPAAAQSMYTPYPTVMPSGQGQMETPFGFTPPPPPNEGQPPDDYRPPAWRPLPHGGWCPGTQHGTGYAPGTQDGSGYAPDGPDSGYNPWGG